MHLRFIIGNGNHCINTAPCEMSLPLTLTFTDFNVSHGVSLHVCVKETKIETLMDGRGHRGSERQRDRETRLFMCVHDQCDQGRLGVFPGDQRLINQS